MAERIIEVISFFILGVLVFIGFISAGNEADTVMATWLRCGDYSATLWRLYGVIAELGSYFLLPFAALATGIKLIA